MCNYNIKITNHNRNDMIEYIEKMRMTNNSFTVVDVGGSMNCWYSQYINAIVDFNDFNVENNYNTKQEIKHFKCDITHPDSWKELLKYVEENGKFDFCICNHTLEDIISPLYVSEQISKIAKEGYISVPSKYRELSRFELGENGYRGYIHHRWIFDIIDNVLIGYPKINYLDCNAIFDSIADINPEKSDLTFFWKDKIDIIYLNDNFLGPDVISVIGYYNNLLN